MESTPPLINQLDTFPILGQYLVNPAHRDPIASVLVLTRNSQISEVCRNFQDCNHLAMQRMWRLESALLEEPNSIPINRELRTADELLAHDRQERIKNSLKGRMLAVVPSGDATSLSADVIGCYRRLFQKQREAVHGSTIQSHIDAFTAVQGRYDPSSFSFARFYENEAVIDDAELEMDQNLELAWPRILETLGIPVPNPPLTASEIKAWIDHPDNEGVWDRTEGLLDLSLLPRNLKCLPKQVCRLTNLTGVDLSQNCLTNLPMEFAVLNNVTYLNLSFNQLSRVPPVICQLAQLRTLDLSYNRLSDLPQELRGNDQLLTLNISHNQFARVPSVISNLTNLYTLDISNNQIGVLPAFLSNPYQMRLYYFFSSGLEQWTLDVSDNPIRSIHCILDNRDWGPSRPLFDDFATLDRLNRVDMDHVEVIELSLQDWIVSHCTLPRLDTRVVCWYVSNATMIVMMLIAAIFVIPIGWALESLRVRGFSFVDRCLSVVSELFQYPALQTFFRNYGSQILLYPALFLLFLPAGLIFLLGALTNTIFWSINMFITGVIGPIVGLARESLGYPPTIRLR